MEYKNRIQKLTTNVDPDLADFNAERVRGRLLFYVKFKDSISVINKEEFENLTGIRLV